MIEVLAECAHPLTITTKGADRARPRPAGTAGGAQAGPRLLLDRHADRELARRLDPRAPAPQRRLELVARGSQPPGFPSA
ncbi:MAG: hypothetical protein IPG28_12195 [Betaproteobacteria bacterium]|nr:hypothetical protein [Betaproteobacteria bacterium]